MDVVAGQDKNVMDQYAMMVPVLAGLQGVVTDHTYI